MGFNVVSLGSNTNTSGATLAITIGAGGVPKGCAIFVFVTEKTTNAVNGTTADTASNTYAAINSGALAATTADGRGIIFASNNSAALVNTNTITYTKNLSGSNCAMSAFYVTGQTSATTFTEGATSATGTTGTITTTSGTLSVGDLVVGVLCDSGSTAAGAAATFTNASGFVTPPVEGNSGTAAAGNARVDGGNKVTQVSGTVVYNPTLSSTAQQWIVFVFGVIASPYAAVEDGTAAIDAMLRQYETVDY